VEFYLVLQIGLIVAATICGILFCLAIKPEKSNWKLCRKELPPKSKIIVNYPVALFDKEFGTIIDQAEYHPGDAHPWRLVPYGDPCKPFAWYDLPYPPPMSER
jgi:hypothetical protein